MKQLTLFYAVEYRVAAPGITDKINYECHKIRNLSQLTGIAYRQLFEFIRPTGYPVNLNVRKISNFQRHFQTRQKSENNAKQIPNSKLASVPRKQMHIHTQKKIIVCCNANASKTSSSPKPHSTTGKDDKTNYYHCFRFSLAVDKKKEAINNNNKHETLT